jgi:DNA-binding CsgD family transcriptional regulator
MLHPKSLGAALPRMTPPSDQLLDRIYDAATEPALWQSVLAEIADLTNSQGGILFGQSVTASAIYFEHNGGLSEECNRVYRQRHMQNPWSLAMESRLAGELVLSDEVISLPSLRSSLFYDEVLRPQDVAHNAMIALAAQRDFRVAFNLCQSPRQGPLGEVEQRLLKSLVPHLCRAFRLGFRIEGYRALQNAQFDALDRLAVGVLLLDRRARVTYANATARSLAASDGILRMHEARVATSSPTHSQRLDELIRAALRGAPAGAMSVPRPDDGQPLTVLASSVRGRDIGRFADLRMPDAAVLLFIIDPANRAGIPISWVMDSYGLTKTEAKVALAASSGLTIPETAKSLGVSQNTIKTHLGRVFAKTGTGRQSELARLMTSIGLVSADGRTPSNE